MTTPTPADWMSISDAAAFRRQVVVELRSASARYPEDPVIAALVDELREGSDHFARLWERRDVQPVSVLRKTLTHPTVGAITVDCDDLHLAEQDQTLVLYSAPAGSESADALQFLDRSLPRTTDPVRGRQRRRGSGW